METNYRLQNYRQEQVLPTRARTKRAEEIYTLCKQDILKVSQ